MAKQVIRPEGAGSNPILSPGMRYGNLVFTAGQVAHDPRTGKMVEGGIAEQARQTMENVKAVLEAAGTTMDHVLKASCFIANLEERPAFNEVYKEYFTSDPPVRTCVEAVLGPGVLIEVDVIAGMPE